MFGEGVFDDKLLTFTIEKFEGESIDKIIEHLTDESLTAKLVDEMEKHSKERDLYMDTKLIPS